MLRPDLDSRWDWPDGSGEGAPECGVDENGLEEEENGWHKVAATLVYEALIHLGGRPSRPLRSRPIWKSSAMHGYTYYDGAKRPCSCSGLARGPCCWKRYKGDEEVDEFGENESKRVKNPWGKEFAQFAAELLDWQEFRVYQEDVREHQRSNATEGKTEPPSYPQDQPLTACLTKLKDWREYRAWHQQALATSEMLQPESEPRPARDQRIPRDRICIPYKGVGRQAWSEAFWLHVLKSRLQWISEQLAVILSECAASLSEAPVSRRWMEASCEADARRIYQTLMEMGGRPTRSIRAVPDVSSREPMDQHLHVLCHWEGEHSQFEEELRQWKEFLDHRPRPDEDGSCEMQPQATESLSTLDLWKECQKFQQSKIDIAKQWVDHCHREMKDDMYRMKAAIKGGLAMLERFANYDDWHVHEARSDTLCYHENVEYSRFRIEETQEQVERTMARLEWIKQQRSAILAECAVPTAEVSIFNYIKEQDILPERASNSDIVASAVQISRQVSRSKRKSTISAALDPMHSSKVIKVAAWKEPRSLRRKFLAECAHAQEQGLNTLPAPSVSLKIASNSAADSSATAKPSPCNVNQRRSERISSQKKTAADSIQAVQADSCKYIPSSRLRSQIKNNHSNANSTKFAGISKRRRKASGKRMKVNRR